MRIEDDGSLLIPLPDCDVRASVLRVPGRDGRGAYVAEVSFDGERDFVETADFRPTPPEAICDLVTILARHGITDISAVRPRLVYGGAWAAGELERQPGYNPRRDPRLSRAYSKFLNLLWAALPPDWRVHAEVFGASRAGVRIRFTRPSGASFARPYYDEVVQRAEKLGWLHELAMSSARLAVRS